MADTGFQISFWPPQSVMEKTDIWELSKVFSLKVMCNWAGGQGTEANLWPATPPNIWCPRSPLRFTVLKALSLLCPAMPSPRSSRCFGFLQIKQPNDCLLSTTIFLMEGEKDGEETFWPWGLLQVSKNNQTIHTGSFTSCWRLSWALVRLKRILFLLLT